MKSILNKLDRDEKGQALIIVLILLVIGGLIIVPLLAYMSTGLMVGQVFEERMDEVYAADAGIEDAVWKIMNSQPLVTPSYLLPELVNGKQVRVTPPSGDDEEITFFINLGVLADKTGNFNKNRPQQPWLLVYNPIVEEDMCNEYRITGLYVAGGLRTVRSTGFWIHEYNEYKYEPGNATLVAWTEDDDSHLEMDLDGDGNTDDLVDIDGDGVIDVFEGDIVTEPLIDPGYTNYDYREVDYHGRAFIWEWEKGGQKGPIFGKGVICRTQRFALDPPIPVDEFPLNVAWLETSENSIQISWFGEVTGINRIIAVATDPNTGKSTTVVSYIFSEQINPEEPVIITILTWDISLQQE